MRKFVLAVVAVVLLATACGGDGDDTLESLAGDDQTSQDDGEGGDNGEDGDAMTGDRGSDWCDAVRAGVDGGDDPLDFDLLGLTPEQLEAQFTENVATLENWESKAPPEIDQQVTTLVDAFRTVADQAEAADWDLVALGSDPAFLEAFDGPELESASRDVDAYSRDVCGVELGTGSATGGQGATPAVPPAVDGGAAVEFLEAFGLPPNFLNDDQLACITAELETAFPDGIPADLTLNAQTIDLFDTVGAACDIGVP